MSEGDQGVAELEEPKRKPLRRLFWCSRSDWWRRWQPLASRKALRNVRPVPAAGSEGMYLPSSRTQVRKRAYFFFSKMAKSLPDAHFFFQRKISLCTGIPCSLNQLLASSFGRTRRMITFTRGNSCLVRNCG